MPLVGTMALLQMSRAGFIAHFTKKYGGRDWVFRFPMFGGDAPVFCEQASIQAIMVDHAGNFIMRTTQVPSEALKRLVGDPKMGILINNEKESWKHNRSLFLRALSPDFIRFSVHSTLKQCVHLFAQIDAQMKSSGYVMHDTGEFMKKISLFTIMEAAFGVDLNTYEKKDEIIPHVTHVFAALNVIMNVPIWLWWVPGLKNKIIEGKKHIYEMRRIAKELTEIRMKQFEEDSEEQKMKRKDFVSLLLRAQNPTEQQKKEEEINGTNTTSSIRLTSEGASALAAALLTAGTDTTSHTLTICFAYLAEFEREQEEVYQEIKSVFGSSFAPDQYSMEKLQQLPYTQNFIQETMRVRPIAPVVTRAAENDIVINGVLVKRNQTVFINTSQAGVDPTVWKDPLRFDPSRWRTSTVPRCGWLPFGTGPRGCPGMRLATIELLAAVTAILHRYRVEMVDGQGGTNMNLVLNGVMVPDRPFVMRLVTRGQ